MSQVFRSNLRIKFFEYKHTVLPAEGKRIRHGDIQFLFTGNMGNIVQVAGGVRVIQVDGWRDDIVIQRLDADDRLQGTGRTDGMTRHGLCGTHRHLKGTITENGFYRLGFDGVVYLC